MRYITDRDRDIGPLNPERRLAAVVLNATRQLFSRRMDCEASRSSV